MALATDNVLAPVKTKARIAFLDVIRGLSILGILAVNADGFAVPTIASLKPLIWPFPDHGWTAISYWLANTDTSSPAIRGAFHRRWA